MRLALALLLLATSAGAAVSPTYTRQFGGENGTDVIYNQVACTAAGTVLVRPENTYLSPTPYVRLSILIKNCAGLGGADVAICPGSATCSFSQGFLLGPREGQWLDWSNGPISCVSGGGTITVCFVEERG